MREPRRRIADLLGVPADESVARLSHLLGEPVDERHLRLRPVAYVSGSPATASLQRVSGRTAAGDPWSLFVKLIRHGRHWPALAGMPPAFAAAFAAEFPWRDELRLWDPRVQASLPDGLRSPVLLEAVELPDDHVALWTEDVQQQPDVVWDAARFRTAASLLGRWNARSSSADVRAVSPFPDGHGLRMYAERTVPPRGLVPLADDALWRHPWLAPHRDLRLRLVELARRIPGFLDTLDALPQCLPHGDASPQNLLVPRPAPEERAALVAIDLSFGTPHAVGFDLGQLLVGLAHAAEMSPAAIPDIAEAVVPAYRDGAAAEGLDLSLETVRTGFVLSVLLRSGFDGFRLDLLGRRADDRVAEQAFTERIGLVRAIVDLTGSVV